MAGGCIDCGEHTQGRCDVCFLVDGDETFKKVVFCETCQAWICNKCDLSWKTLPKRAEAYFRNKFKLKKKKK